MKVLTCEQRSPEWFSARNGVPTASSFNKIITTNGRPSDQAKGYMHALAAQRITGIHEDSYRSAAMDEGIAREETSRLVYSMMREVEVEQVGLCLSDNGRWGASPDGLVGDDGLVELKNPSGKVAVGYLLKGTLPVAYFTQVQGQLFVTERVYCDFVSYYPGLPTFILRVERDEEFIEALHQELITFCDELDAICNKVESRRK